MSRFFQTLIAKHQASGVASVEPDHGRSSSTTNSGTIHFAQPRPKSRYESFHTDSDKQFDDTATSSEADQVDSESMLNQNPASRLVTVAAEPSRLSASEDSTTDASMPAVPTSTATPASNTFPPKPLQTRPEDLAVYITRTLGDNVRGDQWPRHSVVPGDEHGDWQQAVLGRDSDPAMDTLGRLNPASPDVALPSSHWGSAQDTLGESDNDSPRLTPSPATVGVDTPLLIADKSIRGMFETSPQIKQLKTALMSRESNPVRARAEQQPQEAIVNVTIGRVEFKASMAPQAAQTTTPGRPSGVMTLNEYLNKRDRRGDS